MQPWLALTACGHASFVTPTSGLMPPALLPPPGVAEPPRQPASASASTTNAIASRLIEPPASSVRERKGLPVVANPDPDAEQAARLENQEPDDEDPVEHGLQLVGVRGVGRRVAEHRKQQRDLPGRPGQQRDEQRAEDRARDRAGATDQHHRDVLHRQQQVERARVEEAADGVEQRTGAAGVEGRDGERDRLVPGQVHPDHAGRDVPVADRRERAPYLRARQVARREREHQQEHEHEQVQLLVLGEHARDVEAVPEQGRHGGGAAHPRPAGELGPGLEDVPADEDQPERDDRQVQPAQPGRQRRDEHAREPRHEAGRGQPDQDVVDAEAQRAPVRVTGDGGRRVGTDRDEERMPERDLSGVPGDQVEPDGADGGDAGQREQLQDVVREQERHGEPEHHQRRHGDLLGHAVQQRHVLCVRSTQLRPASHTRSTSRVPNSPYVLMLLVLLVRPYGLTTDTLPPSHDTWPWYVPTSDSTTPTMSPPSTAPGNESRPPRMMTGSAFKAISHSCWSTPPPAATKTPATAASAPARAQDSAKTAPTLTPCARAASWS